MFNGAQVVLKLSTVLAMPFRGSDEIDAGFNGLKLLKTTGVLADMFLSKHTEGNVHASNLLE